MLTYSEIRKAAKGKTGFCYSCPVCNGAACGNTMPGPGCKGSGKTAKRNYDAWQDILVNMDTIGVERTPDTGFSMFGMKFALPVFAGPMGVVAEHYSDLLDQKQYDTALVTGCAEGGSAAFTADGLQEHYFAGGCESIRDCGFGIPTVKPRAKEIVFQKIDFAKKCSVKALCMDVDASGLPFLKRTNPPSGRKTVEELKEVIDYAGMPFIIKGIMTPQGAEKALEAGACAIVVSNHGGRVLDCTPATAWVLPEIVKSVGDQTTVLVDGGIRTGMDVFKALALGADAVMIARPFANCVYAAGAEGVKVYLNQLREELSDTMQMCGCNSLSDIGKHNIWTK